MNHSSYLDDRGVRDFLHWMAPLVSGERPLHHRWDSPKKGWGPWSCASLFGAYEAYDWPFTAKVPGELSPRRGHSYDDTVEILKALTEQLRRSAAVQDAPTFLEAAVGVVRWGGVFNNEARLRVLGTNALLALTTAARQLEPTVADLGDLAKVIDMNSGFSKIYSLLNDGFPIYDSRVACALASLVRLYCEESNLAEVPKTLAFGIPASRGSVSRDPSTATFRFPRLRAGQPQHYAVSNIKAAWLMGALAAMPPFGTLANTTPLFALESALFMIGYAPINALDHAAG